MSLCFFSRKFYLYTAILTCRGLKQVFNRGTELKAFNTHIARGTDTHVTTLINIYL